MKVGGGGLKKIKPLCNVCLQAYLEFFTSRENVEALKTILPQYPLVNYHIVDHSVSESSMDENVVHFLSSLHLLNE